MPPFSIRLHTIRQFFIKLSHMPSVKNEKWFHHAVWPEDAVHEQGRKEPEKYHPLVYELKWTVPVSHKDVTPTQDLFP